MRFGPRCLRMRAGTHPLKMRLILINLIGRQWSRLEIAYVYVCICNALNEKKVDAAVAAGATRPADVYAHHACEVQCGKCVRDVHERLRDANQDDALVDLRGMS